jgi:8-oxo-dGTP diphosphatase
MSEPKQRYCCGFVFSYDQKQVLLMLKNKPDWQRGRYNGIGGKCEEGEPYYAAMAREQREEILGHVESWRQFAILDTVGAEIAFFFGHGHVGQMLSRESEIVQVFDVDKLPLNAIPNVRWLMPMALSMTRGEQCSNFIVQEAHS